MNPFWILGVPTTASAMDIQRAGQKWLGMLEIGVASASLVETPDGVCSRTPELVRQAMADLRDPERRLVAELWARTPAVEPESFSPWSDARAVLCGRLPSPR